MAENMEKIKKLRDEYYSLLIILEGVLSHIAQYPYLITEGDAGNNILKWQLEMKQKLSEVETKLNKEYDKASDAPVKAR